MAMHTVRSQRMFCERLDYDIGLRSDRGDIRLDEDHRRPAKTLYRGLGWVRMHAYRVAAAYNLVRIAKLSPVPA